MHRRRFLAGLAALLAAGPARADKVFELLLVDGQLTSRSSTLRVKRGEKVNLRWTSDRAMVLHLHGYDLEVRVAPQSPALMSFTAGIAGRFPVTEHAHGPRHHRAVLYLEVHP